MAEYLHDSAVPFDSSRIGAAAVYCSDGRFGEQCDDFVHHALQLPRYDRLRTQVEQRVSPATLPPTARRMPPWPSWSS